MTVVLGVLVIALSWLLRPQLFAVANDEAHARTTGLRVNLYTVLISVLAAVTVSVAMRTVGLLLVSALMVIPVATSQQFARSFRATMLGAMTAGVIAALLGLGTSAFVDVPPGATIVLIALAGFALTAPVGLTLQRRRAAQRPFPVAEEETAFGTAEHQHLHGPGCGHLAIEHGDHVDYIHDGHRHAAHGEHYDEH